MVLKEILLKAMLVLLLRAASLASLSVSSLP
jgi:hypothetical protein